MRLHVPKVRAGVVPHGRQHGAIVGLFAALSNRFDHFEDCGNVAVRERAREPVCDPTRHSSSTVRVGSSPTTHPERRGSALPRRRFRRARPMAALERHVGREVPSGARTEATRIAHAGGSTQGGKAPAFSADVPDTANAERREASMHDCCGHDGTAPPRE